MRLTSAPRTVATYLGCSQATADLILGGATLLASEAAYDWLGEGVYFWE